MSVSSVRQWLFVATVAAVSVGCERPPTHAAKEPHPKPEQQYTVCADDYTKNELVEFLDGNLVIVASHVDHGESAGAIVGWLAVSLLFNGIDFSNLAYEPTFSDGTYEVTNGDASLGFQLFFNDDFGDHSAGDVVPYNLFDVESYVRNLEVTGVDFVTGEVEYDYDPGPATEVLDGDIEIDVDDAANFTVRANVRGELFAFEAFSEGTQAPHADDELHIVMTTTRAPMLDVNDQLAAGEYGFNYTGTTYDSEYFGIDQEFTDSSFLIGSDGDDGSVWTGNYASTVITGPATLYQSGFVSNLEQNYTEYYCDEDLTEKVGVALHRLDLLGGEFVFEDGTKIPYGLGPS